MSPKQNAPEQPDVPAKPETEPASPEVDDRDSRTVVTHAQQWSGPIPPPAMLAEFDRVVPGAAERILRLTEQETGHRIEWEKKALDANISESRRGQWLGAGISALAVTGAVWAALAGVHYVVPIALVGVPVMAIARAIVDSRSQRGE